MSACQKDSLQDHQISDAQNTSSLRQNSGQTAQNFNDVDVPLMSTARYSVTETPGTDPSLYFGDTLYNNIAQRMELEQAQLNQLGFSAYLDQLVADSSMSAATRDLMDFIYDKALNEDPESYFLDEFEAEVETGFGNHIPIDQFDSTDYLYIIVYRTFFDIVNNYKNPDGSRTRGSCSFGEAILTIYTEIGKGIGGGAFLGKIIKELTDGDGILFVVKAGGVVVEVTGGVIGGVVGLAVGIYKSIFGDEECDCNMAANILRLRDNDCDLTSSFRAIGTGGDATVWQWEIVQGPTTATIFTSAPEVTVTQLDPNIPIQLSVQPQCQDPVIFSPTYSFDLTEKFSPVGGTNIIGGDGLDEAGPGSLADYESKVGRKSRFSASALAPGPVTYDWTISPASAASIIYDNAEELRVEWITTGIVDVTVTATNTCGGATQSATVTIFVTN